MPVARTNNLLALRRLGQSPWLDLISRDILTSGELRRMIEEEGITGITSNPSIFEKAINSSSAYDDDIRRLAGEGKTAEEIYEALSIADVGQAADLLLPAYRRSRGNDGFVSLEVSPHCAYDAPTTRYCARRVCDALGRKNAFIKIPATEAGVQAIEEALVAGINVNATLIISLAHYESVAAAYLRALHRRLEQGLGVAGVHSVASVFVSRVDTAVDRILDGMAAAATSPSLRAGMSALRGRAAVANSAAVYGRYLEIFGGDEHPDLEKAGARPQKIVWGSTSTKDPGYSDIKYVTEIIARGTITTIPLATLKAFQDHGAAKIALTRRTAGPARLFLDRLHDIGIELDAICQQIQDEGVKAFVDSHDALVAAIEKKRRAAAEVRGEK